jgi:hypothetical protein
MPNMTASIPHQLGREEAKRRIQQHIGAARQQYGAMASNVREEWEDNQLDFAVTAMGQAVSGNLVVHDDMVHLTVALTGFLGIFAGTIKQRVEQQGKDILSLTRQPGDS